MITVDNGHITMQGDEPKLMQETVLVLKSLREIFEKEFGEKSANDLIDDIVEVSKVKDEDLHDFIINSIKKQNAEEKELRDELKKSINKLMKTIFGEDEDNE